MPRRLRYQVAVSLDGFIAGPNGEYDWIVMDPAIDFAALFAEFDTAIMGRKTYEALVAQGGDGALPGLDVVVFSRTLPAATLLASASSGDDPPAVVSALKAHPAGTSGSTAAACSFARCSMPGSWTRWKLPSCRFCLDRGAAAPAGCAGEVDAGRPEDAAGERYRGARVCGGRWRRAGPSHQLCQPVKPSYVASGFSRT